MLGEAADVLPGRATVLAPEEPGRLDAGEDRAVGAVARLHTVATGSPAAPSP